MKERFFCNVECRALDERRIAGTASVTFDKDLVGSEYQLFEDHVERIAPGAFDQIIRTGTDTVALFNHNPDHVLGRTPLTLRLSADKQGLHYEIDLPDTTIARDLHKSITRGDIRGSSFAAIVAYAEWSREGKTHVRTIKRFSSLLDVSPVTYPAFTATGTIARSVERREIELERDAFWRRIETERIVATKRR